jgi:general stress protein 26
MARETQKRATRNSAKREDDLKKVQELINGINIAMLTTRDSEGNFRSRPMATQEVEFDGDLWFFTGRDTDKVEEIAEEPLVGLSYAAPDKNRYVSVSGTAEVNEDRDKMKELWSPALKAWFPDGLEDPTLILIRVEVHKVEYWEYPANKVAELIGFVKAIATGQPADDMGENKTLDLENARPKRKVKS